MDESHTELPSSYIVKFLVFWTLLKTCINSAIKFQIAVANKASLVVLPFLTYWVKEHVYNLSNHLVITTNNVTAYTCLLANIH